MLQLVEPESVGLSTARLGRIHRHLDSYLGSGRYPGFLILVSRHRQPTYLVCQGHADVEAKKPVAEDTIFRIYSMTKPIASVALLTLYERGLFQLDDPVSDLIPSFAGLRVWGESEGADIRTIECERPMTVRDLMTHTSGLTYGFMQAHPVDALYRELDVEGSDSLEEMVAKLAEIPLLFQPGARWSYSVATDVCGHLVQVLADEPLPEYLERVIFDPLGMSDTAFWVPDEKLHRFAACYDYAEGTSYTLQDPPGTSRYRRPPTLPSAGGGLVSTAEDYFRFTNMLLGKGEGEESRILSRKTVELMTTNHLPGNVDLAAMGQAVFSETPYAGIGFGLGVSVLLDPATSQILGSPGEFAWGGAASTAFWIDPTEELTVIFLTQLLPSSSYPVRRELRVLAYQAIDD